MYIDCSPISAPQWSRDLNQGDVLADLLLPDFPLDKSFCLKTGTDKIKWPAKSEDLAAASGSLMVQSRLKREPYSLVLSNSCDNALGGLPVLVCPIRDFTFLYPGDDRRWQQIQVAATGTANAKQFYLADRAPLPRSSALLAEIRPLSHEYLARCFSEAGTRRLFGLSASAARHLQHAMMLLFARDPRDDDEWPSTEDFKIKAAALRIRIDAGGPDVESIQAELTHVEEILSARAALQVAGPLHPR